MSVNMLNQNAISLEFGFESAIRKLTHNARNRALAVY